MSWIKEVRTGIQELDLSVKNLKKFGIFVGCIFALIVVLMWFYEYPQTLQIILSVFSVYLLISAFLYPNLLKYVYTFWMGIALVIGGLISRIILIALFFLVITPIGITLKLSGKKMLDIKQNEEKNTYWITKKTKKINYEKMY
ncbi:MAG: SxtJ family membrane protein [bacterium]